jgi:hypothetical protein
MLQSLLVGTTNGVYRVANGGARLAGLKGVYVTHLSVSESGAAAAAAVPIKSPMHVSCSMPQP